MAGSKVIECVGPSYHLTDRKAAVQTAVNCYPKQLDGDNWMLRSAPGVSVNNSFLVRGSVVIDDRWFIAGGPAGNQLYEVDRAGNFTARGMLQTSTGFVGMAVNESQVAIVDGANLYVYNYATATFTGPVASPGWRGSDDVQQMDGYFIFVAPGTQQFYISAIDDATNLNALDFSSADSSPDNIMTHRVSHRQLWLFGKSNSTEIWVNSGAAAFPFVRYQSYTLDIGCVGKRAAVIAADTIFWIGSTDRGTGIVYMATGNQPQRVSNVAIEEALRNTPDLSLASMWSYQTQGAEFVGIECPGLEKTLVFDASTKLWHERGEWLDQWYPLNWSFVVFFKLNYAVSNEHWVGVNSSYKVGAPTQLGEMSDGENTLFGRPLVRERTWPHLMQPSLEPTSFLGLELAMASGNGGSVTLEISNDGGYTFNAPLLRALGAIGRFIQRMRWLGLGAAIDRVFRIRCSDPVPFAIHSATVDT